MEIDGGAEGRADLPARAARACPDCGRRFGEAARFCPFDGTPLRAASAEENRDPLLGRVIGQRYEVEALLGEGGMGRVYRVRHLALDRRFALKVLRRELMRDPSLAERFVREARAVALLRHPGVVAITDFGTLEEGVPYFVMELLLGETLAERLRRSGPLPIPECVRIATSVASAVEAAHQAGIVHRDLKPDNVFLVQNGPGASEPSVRVVDFGAAKIAGDASLTREGIVFGTPHYMSPEHARGEAVDARADVYALGCMLFEMLTGRLPFDGDQFMLIMSQHLHKAPPLPSSVPGAPRPLGALDAIVLRALAKKPDERFASMTAFSDALMRCVHTTPDGRVLVASRLGQDPDLEPLGAAPPGASEMPPPRRSSAAPRKAPVWLAASLALVGGFGALVFATMARTSGDEAAAGAPAGSSGSTTSTSTSSATPTPTSSATPTPTSTPAPPPSAAPSAEPPAAPKTGTARPRSSEPRREPAVGQPDLGDPWADKAP